jgi:hypothetical protein
LRTDHHQQFGVKSVSPRLIVGCKKFLGNCLTISQRLPQTELNFYREPVPGQDGTVINGSEMGGEMRHIPRFNCVSACRSQAAWRLTATAKAAPSVGTRSRMT